MAELFSYFILFYCTFSNFADEIYATEMLNKYAGPG